jgi:hypothetical protein
VEENGWITEMKAATSWQLSLRPLGGTIKGIALEGTKKNKRKERNKVIRAKERRKEIRWWEEI